MTADSSKNSYLSRSFCPAKSNCTLGESFPDTWYCSRRCRDEKGLFHCGGFQPIKNVKLDNIEPEIELFPDHDYSNQPK